MSYMITIILTTAEKGSTSIRTSIIKVTIHQVFPLIVSLLIKRWRIGLTCISNVVSAMRVITIRRRARKCQAKTVTAKSFRGVIQNKNIPAGVSVHLKQNPKVSITDKTRGYAWDVSSGTVKLTVSQVWSYTVLSNVSMTVYVACLIRGIAAAVVGFGRWQKKKKK